MHAHQSALPSQTREPMLLWRTPALLWTMLALAPALGLPALILMGEGGLGQMAIAAIALGYFAAIFSLAVAAAFGRAPRTRREVALHVVWMGVAAALTAPIAFQALLVAMEGIEAPSGPIGLSPALPLALWPLALIVSLPFTLFAGLSLSVIAFKREDAPPMEAPRALVQPPPAPAQEPEEESLF